MKPKYLPYWLALGLTLLFIPQALVAAERILAAGNIEIHLSEKVFRSAEARYGPNARRRLVAWISLIAANKSKSDAEKLKQTNTFINRITYTPDQQNWGRPKYWATPVEMLASNGGDAEDYAIGKYFTLLAMGVGMEHLHITYVKAANRPPAEQAHMVLTYYPSPDSMPLVLDNFDPEIRTADERSDLTPIYTFNGDGLWLAKERNAGNTDDNVNMWNEMNARMGKELSADGSMGSLF